MLWQPEKPMFHDDHIQHVWEWMLEGLRRGLDGIQERWTRYYAAQEEALRAWQEAMSVLCAKRVEARARKDWAAADALRDAMLANGAKPVDFKDGGSEWVAVR